MNTNVIRRSFAFFIKPSKIRPHKSRDYQEFVLFLETKEDLIKYIDWFRRVRQINLAGNLEKLKKYKELAIATEKAWNKALKKRNDDVFAAVRDADYLNLKKKSELHWKAIETEANCKFTLKDFTLKDIEEMLILFNKPLSWTMPLSFYILTGAIIPPHVDINIETNDRYVILKIPAEASGKDCRLALKQVHPLKQFLKGGNLKDKRIKPKFDEKIKILKASKKFKNPYEVIDKVYGGGSIENLKNEKKKKEIIKKTKKRYKR